MPGRTTRQWPLMIWLTFLILHPLPFTGGALELAWGGLVTPELTETRLHVTGSPAGNIAIFAHMALGALMMVLVPLQFWPGLRARFTAVHRWSGRALCLGGVMTGVAGLSYILMRGTIGGLWMDLGFGLYGLLVILCAGQAIRHARARAFERHRRWALRLAVLVFGSWLYRVHYGLWYLATDGWGSTPAFDGPFDLVQNVAFYLPYLLLLEVWLRRGRGAPSLT